MTASTPHSCIIRSSVSLSSSLAGSIPSLPTERFPSWISLQACVMWLLVMQQAPHFCTVAGHQRVAVALLFVGSPPLLQSILWHFHQSYWRIANANRAASNDVRAHIVVHVECNESLTTPIFWIIPNKFQRYSEGVLRFPRFLRPLGRGYEGLPLKAMDDRHGCMRIWLEACCTLALL